MPGFNLRLVGIGAKVSVTDTEGYVGKMRHVRISLGDCRLGLQGGLLPDQAILHESLEAPQRVIRSSKPCGWRRGFESNTPEMA